MTVEPFDSFQMYQAIKLHFESKSYDALKYNFKTSVNAQSFFKRKDKYFFAKAGKQYGSDLVNFYVANFVRGAKWVGEMLNSDGEQNYTDHQKVHQSLTYHFDNDISMMANEGMSLDETLKSIDGKHPEAVRYYLQERIRLETLVILDKMTGFMDHADKQISETIVWPDVYLKVSKYRSFVNPDINRCKKIVLDNFEQ
jgi:hypothetical protein